MSETFKESFIRFLDLHCGINEFEILIPLIKKRLKRMLEKTVDVIKMFENDKILKKSEKAIKSYYEIKERIENLFEKMR